jgi:ethanolamine utilization protein EutN
MILGRVTGQLWATQKAERLTGHKLLIVTPERGAYGMQADHVVAIDPVGAEVGQRVLVMIGAPGRHVAGDLRTPIDASIAAIVDDVS